MAAPGTDKNGHAKNALCDPVLKDEVNSDSSIFETKHCRACHSKIPVKANKCVPCGSVQNNERFLSFSGSILGLLVALISVVTFAVPVITSAIHSPRPKPRVALIETSSDGFLDATISNGGDAPMAVGDMTFLIKGEPNSGVTLSIRDASLLVVKPNEIRPVKLEIVYSTPIANDRRKPIGVQVFNKRFNENYRAQFTNGTHTSNDCQFSFTFVDPSGIKQTQTMVPTKDYCGSAETTLFVGWCQRTGGLREVCKVQ